MKVNGHQNHLVTNILAEESQSGLEWHEDELLLLLLLLFLRRLSI